MFNKNLGPKAPLFTLNQAKKGKVPFRPEPFFGEKRVFSGEKTNFPPENSYVFRGFYEILDGTKRILASIGTL